MRHLVVVISPDNSLVKSGRMNLLRGLSGG